MPVFNLAIVQFYRQDDNIKANLRGMEDAYQEMME